MTFLEDAARDKATRRAELLRALAGYPAEEKPEAETPETATPKKPTPSFDGGARQTPPTPVSESEFLSAVLEDARQRGSGW